MATTKQLPREDWHSYFEKFTSRHVSDTQETVTIEVLSPEIGDQIEARDVPLLGITYDPKDDLLDVFVGDTLDHLIFTPREIYVVEEDDGFVSSLQVTRDEGVREVLQMRRGQPDVRDTEAEAVAGT